jgi:hypothetical protein
MTGRTTLSALALLVGTATFAQEKCLSRTISERWWQAHGVHVDLAQEAAKLEQAGAAARGGSDLQVIPVVVHVVWNTSAENVSDGVIMNILNQMNEDYQALNSDYNNVRPVFNGTKGNADIEFCLATLDPNGSPTTGIIRQHTNETWFDPDNETDDMKVAPNGSPAWDPLHYLNIWICDITSGASGGLVTVGYAYLPYGGVVGTYIDGLVLDYSYAAMPGDRTATHEVGHYFGLDHPWGEGNCTPGDGISDTPPTDAPTFSCSNTSLMHCNTLTQYENFMDYSNCPVMFTNGQAAAMAGILNTERSELLNSNGCEGGSSSTLCVPTSTNGTADGDYINGVELEGISNLNSGSDSGPTYTDFTGLSTTLDRGNSYTVQVTTGEYVEDTVAVWIDYNQNGTLNASELIGSAVSSSDFQVIPFTFTVPMSASPGNTVMRVRVYYPDSGEPASPDPCADYSWGETEDYGIVISSPAAIAENGLGALSIRNLADRVEVDWDQPGTVQQLYILDASGRVLRSISPAGNHATIGTEPLASGIYQLVLTSDTGRRSGRFAVGMRP